MKAYSGIKTKMNRRLEHKNNNSDNNKNNYKFE